jgi:hypothetical protein
MMVDDHVLPSLEATQRLAIEAKARGQADFTVSCWAYNRPWRRYIYVHGCIAKVLKRYVNVDGVDCLLVRLGVVDVLERYRREAVRQLEAGNTPSQSNRRRSRPRNVMSR